MMHQNCMSSFKELGRDSAMNNGKDYVNQKRFTGGDAFKVCMSTYVSALASR